MKLDTGTVLLFLAGAAAGFAARHYNLVAKVRAAFKSAPATPDKSKAK